MISLDLEVPNMGVAPNHPVMDDHFSIETY